VTEQPASTLHVDNQPGTQDTSEDSFLAPGQDLLDWWLAEDPDQDPEYYLKQVQKLATWLETNFGDEVHRTNVQRPETPVDLAIRLMAGFAHSSGLVERCDTEYCNKPKGHTDPHGIVHRQ